MPQDGENKVLTAGVQVVVVSGLIKVPEHRDWTSEQEWESSDNAGLIRRECRAA
jgi:hypothetical protein